MKKKKNALSPAANAPLSTPGDDTKPTDNDNQKAVVDKPSRKKKILGYAKSAAIYLVIFIALSTVLGQLRAPDLPDQAPPFRLFGLDGQVYDSAQLKGKKVVLNFWAPWCGPCRVEVPMIRNFANNNPEVLVLGVAVDGGKNGLPAAAQDLGITYPVAMGSQEVVRSYKATTLPTTVVIDETGKIVMTHVGIITQLQLWWATF